MAEQPPGTQQSSSSKRVYMWVILFHYDVNDEFPFSCVLLENFKESDFPFRLITGQLGLEDRLKPIQFSKMPGPKYCLFAKVEEGTPAKRRNEEVSRLNQLYANILPVRHTIQKCLKYMCQTEPYRMLNDWTYEMSADPISSETTALSQPDFTDVEAGANNEEEIDFVTQDVIFNLTQEIEQPKKLKLSRKKRNEIREEALNNSSFDSGIHGSPSILQSASTSIEQQRKNVVAETDDDDNDNGGNVQSTSANNDVRDPPESSSSSAAAAAAAAAAPTNASATDVSNVTASTSNGPAASVAIEPATSAPGVAASSPPHPSDGTAAASDIRPAVSAEITASTSGAILSEEVQNVDENSINETLNDLDTSHAACEDEISRCQTAMSAAINSLNQLRKSSLSPGRLQEAEGRKLDEISNMSGSLLDLKKKKSAILSERSKNMQTKSDMVKKLRLEEYKQKSKDLDDRERDLCRKTNQLVDEFVATCDNSPFHKSLIKILNNLKVAMNTTRNNSKVCGDNVSLLTDTVHSLEVAQEFHFQKFEQAMEKLNTIHFNVALALDVVNIDRYLPIKSDEEALRFCGNEDGLFDQRQTALMRRIYGAGDISSIANFVGSVTDIIFHIDYQISHRWPSNNRKGKSGVRPPVPAEFVHLVHITLYKLVGNQLIPKELVCLEFFAKMRVWFQNANKKMMQNVEEGVAKQHGAQHDSNKQPKPSHSNKAVLSSASAMPAKTNFKAVKGIRRCTPDRSMTVDEPDRRRQSITSKSVIEFQFNTFLELQGISREMMQIPKLQSIIRPYLRRLRPSSTLAMIKSMAKVATIPALEFLQGKNKGMGKGKSNRKGMKREIEMKTKEKKQKKELKRLVQQIEEREKAKKLKERMEKK